MGVVILFDYYQGKGLIKETSDELQQQQHPPRTMGFDLCTPKTILKYGARGGQRPF